MASTSRSHNARTIRGDVFSSRRSTASKIGFPHSPRSTYHRVSLPVELGKVDIIPAQIRVVFNNLFNQLSIIAHFTNVLDRQSGVSEDGLTTQDAFSFFNPT